LANDSQVVALLQHPLHPLLWLQTQEPPTQVVPAPHTVPQPPQLLLSCE